MSAIALAPEEARNRGAKIPLYKKRATLTVALFRTKAFFVYPVAFPIDTTLCGSVLVTRFSASNQTKNALKFLIRIENRSHL